MRIEAETVTSIVRQTWSSMLGLDVDWLEAGPVQPEPAPSVFCCLEFLGAWHGTVRMHCPAELARYFAGAMFGADPDSLSIEEVHDAVGELVNIIGGSLKSCFPKPCQMSLPVVRETDQSPPPPECLVTTLALGCLGSHFHIAILETQAAVATASSER